MAYNIEYGAETNEQSSLNLLYLLGYSAKDELELFGDSDERYHIHGGNDQLVSGLAAKLAGQVELGAELRALVRQPDGRIKLVVHQGSSTREVIAGQVVLALPFSILRAWVDLSRAGFSALKLKVSTIWGWEPIRSYNCSSPNVPGTTSATPARAMPTLATRIPGRQPARSRAPLASWLTTRAAPSASK